MEPGLPVKQVSSSPAGPRRTLTVLLAVATIWLIITVAVMVAMMVMTPSEFSSN